MPCPVEVLAPRQQPGEREPSQQAEQQPRQRRRAKGAGADEIRNQPIIGVGAAAKANTFLNFYNIDSTILDYVTDASEHKKGKYTPLTRIPIVGDEVFEKYNKVYALVLSWNISDILIEKIIQ